MKSKLWQKLPANIKRAVEVGETADFGVYLLDRTPNFHFKGLEFPNRLRYSIDLREPKHNEFTVVVEHPKPLDQYSKSIDESWDEVKERVSTAKPDVRKDTELLLKEARDSGGFDMLKKAGKVYDMRSVELENILRLADAIRALDHAEHIKSNHLAEAIQYGITREDSEPEEINVVVAIKGGTFHELWSDRDNVKIHKIDIDKHSEDPVLYSTEKAEHSDILDPTEMAEKYESEITGE